jgi:hypothetical protein
LSTSAEEPDPWDRFSDFLSNRFDGINQRLDELTQQVEKHDEMLAMLLASYTQLWSGLEALMGLTLDEKPEEEREKFKAAVAWYSSELWKAMRHSGDLGRSHQETPGAVDDVPGGERPGGPDT